MNSKTFERFEENFLALLLVGMTLLVFLEVILRFGFNTGIFWAQEVTLHMSAWFVLFGASYGIRVGAHIGVDAVIRLIPHGMPRRTVSLIAVALCLAYCGLFIYGGWIYLAKVYSIGLGMEDARVPMILAELLSEGAAEFLRIDMEDPLIPLWFAHGPIVLGFILLSYRLLQVGWMFATGEQDSFHLADEAKDALEHEKEAHEHEEKIAMQHQIEEAFDKAITDRDGLAHGNNQEGDEK